MVFRAWLGAGLVPGAALQEVAAWGRGSSGGSARPHGGEMP